MSWDENYAPASFGKRQAVTIIRPIFYLGMKAPADDATNALPRAAFYVRDQERLRKEARPVPR